MMCRHCGTPLTHAFLDLGFAPPSNAYLMEADLCAPETYYPLKLYVCDHCWLVQTEDYARANELFCQDYAYFSSTSTSWVAHAARYVGMIRKRLQLDRNSFVIEVAANDGYLLQHFLAEKIPCLGIEPTDSTATAAEKLGIPIRRDFFGLALAQELAAEDKQADLIVGNNVYAHVPNINDFTLGLKTALKQGGTITLEFPHVMQLLEHTQFDTVYHEHFSYLSLYTVARIFETADLRVFDIELLPTHGGSLRVYGCHSNDSRETSPSVSALLHEEHRRDMQNLSGYSGFQSRAEQIKDDLLTFLIDKKRCSKTVVAYGAAAKGNTLLNFAGIKADMLSFVCDAAPAKQGKYMPGSHIPILPPSALESTAPDYVLILPWNISHEIRSQLSQLVARGTRFVTAIPRLEIT